MITFPRITLALALAGTLVSMPVLADGMPANYYAAAPVVAPFSWTGIYFGVNAGYADASSSSSSKMVCADGVSCGFISPNDLNIIGNTGTGSFSSGAFVGGVQAGYNVQSGTLVVGVETDFNAFSLDMSRTGSGVAASFGGDPFSTATKVTADWLYTARLRAGFVPVSNLLVYVTGGLAVTDLHVTNSFTDTLSPVYAGTSSRSSVKPGWTIGGGVEWALGNNWTVKGEYLYVDFGSVKTTTLINSCGAACPPFNDYTTRADLNANIVRAGLNYKF